MKRTIVRQAARASATHLAVNISGTTDRDEMMGRMDLNALTRGNGCGVLTDEQLAGWLNGANVTRHPDDFGSFEILFGFDRHAQDFIVVKSKNPDGPHFAIIAEQGV